jgi:phosphoglycerate dehydrogenase-like enzyme
MKAVLQYRASPGFRELLARRTPDWLEITVINEDENEADTHSFSATIQAADVLLHVLEPVTAAVIQAAPRLRLIQKIGVGVNTIDIQAAQQRGIAVANMPGTNTTAVVEMTLLLMLATLRQVTAFDTATRQGQGWQAELSRFDMIGEIAGQTIGLVGYGAVASRLAPVLQVLGAKVLYTARSKKADAVAAWRPLSKLLQESDLVSLHLPLTDETTNLMNAATFAAMKPGSVFINTARGGLVDEEALLAALQSGHLRAAGLDVFATEPLDVNNPLLALTQVVVTPHIAWLTPQTLERSLGVALENCRRLRDGESLLHQVV